MRVWLNIDAGELPDEPELLVELAHVVNVACGGHAGDDASMLRLARRCAEVGTALGAHPSYADREGFGRRPQAIAPAALRAVVAEQCERLLGHADAAGVRVRFVKPHGALYHAADADRATAEAVVAGAIEVLGYDVTVIGPGGGALADAAARA